MKQVKPLQLFAYVKTRSVKASKPYRLIGLDMGDSCVGGALSNPLNTSAKGAYWWHTSPGAIDKMTKDLLTVFANPTAPVVGLVVGYPFDPDSTDTTTTGGKHVWEVIKKLEDHGGIPMDTPYTFADEFGSTALAHYLYEREFQHAKAKGIVMTDSDKKEWIDKTSARIILKRYLKSMNAEWNQKYQ